jgi:hypothetical protein
MAACRPTIVALVGWAGIAAAQIVAPHSRFDPAAPYWYATADSPWAYAHAGRDTETNSLAWIQDEKTRISTAPLISLTVQRPTGGGYNYPTYTDYASKTVARLDPGQGYIEFDFPALPPGVRHLRVYGFSTNTVSDYTAHSGWVGGLAPNPASVRQPLELQWEINDGPNGETNVYRMLGFYLSDRKLWEVQRLFVVGRAATNNLSARLSVSANSLVSLDVARLEFVEDMDFSRTNLWKTAPTMYTEAERAARMASASGWTNEPFASWKLDNPSFGVPTAQSTWNAMHACWPGFHVTYGEGMGTTFSLSSTWSIVPRSVGNKIYGDWRYALAFTNAAGMTLTATNWLDGTVPGYGGMDYDAATTNWTCGVVAHFGQNGTLDYRVMGLIGSTDGAIYNPFQRWHYFPAATNAVHHGACALANYMAMYPSIDYERSVSEMLDNESPNYGYKFSSQTPRRKGRHAYDGWQGQRAEQIARSIDDGWDYLRGSTALAQDLTREWPFINNDTNQVAIFFNRILDFMVKDYDATTARGNPWTLGLVLQSGADSMRLMDAARTSISITPDGGGGAKHQYASSLSQQGTHYIGSLYYAYGGIMSDAYDTFRYYALGGSAAPYDLSNLAVYRKIAAWADLCATLPVANGYHPDFGDASKRNWQGPELHASNWRRDWRMLETTASPNRFRMAKYLRDVAGRGELSDAEWAAVTNQAAQAACDIRRAESSRVLPGIGLAIMEAGLGSTNDVERAALILKTGVGYGHDHSDHLDLNYFALKARLLPDFGQRYEGAMLMYPYSYVQDVHNVVSVGGWDDPRPTDTEGSNSGNWLFSDTGSAGVMAAELWPAPGLPIVAKSRMAVLVQAGTNTYAAGVQRVNAATNHATWNFGTTHIGPGTDDFVCNVPLTALPATGGSNTLTYKFRKHAFTGEYWPAANTNLGHAVLEFRWKLSSASGTRGNIANLDGNGGTVQVYNASANMGAATNTFLMAQLFDRTNDYVVAADAFSPYYGYLTRRAYVLPAPNGPNVNTTYLELIVPHVGSNFMASSASLPVPGQPDDATATKVLRVQWAGYTDHHFFGPEGTNRLVTVDGMTFDGAYGFCRENGTGAVEEVKLVGGGCLTNGDYSLTLARRFTGGTVTGPDYVANTFTVTNWTGVRRTGWYRFHNPAHHAEYYITNFDGNVVSWRNEALIGTVDVADGYTSGNTIPTDQTSLPVLDYPKRRTGVTFVNERRTRVFQGNAGTNVIRLAGDTVVGSDFCRRRRRRLGGSPDLRFRPGRYG